MYSKEEETIHFVFKAFQGMKRKKEDIDLSFHSIMVGAMLKDIGCNQETVCIGYLHDIIEDTKYSYEDLIKMFDKNICDGIMQLTEDKRITNFIERKKQFMEKLGQADNNIIIVELADKLQNLISDYSLYLEKGANFLVTECDNFEELKYYYLELQKLFNEKLDNNSLLERYNKIINIYFKNID